MCEWWINSIYRVIKIVALDKKISAGNVKYMSQSVRLRIFAIYIITLYLLGGFGTGDWVIGPTSFGLWCYAILTYLVLHLITAPFFETPKDVIANTITCLVFIVTFDFNSIISTAKLYITTLWWIAIVYLGLLLIFAIFAILCKNSTKNFWQLIGKASFRVSSDFGNGKIEFSFIVLLSIFGYHLSYPTHILVLSLFWLLLITVEPIESISKLIKSILLWRKAIEKGGRVGIIISYENPNLALIAVDNNINSQNVTFFCLVHGDRLTICIPLCQGCLQDKSLFRVFLTNSKYENIVSGLEGEVFIIPIENFSEKFQQTIKNEKIYNKKSKVLGFVAEGSCLNHIYIDIINSNEQLYEGRLLEVSIGNDDVIYQITDATLRCERLAQKNSEGFTRGLARKVGIWKSDKDRFEMIDRMPNIYEPVFMCDTENIGFDKDYVGYIPGSKYRIKYDTSRGVTHNTAILGILGIGKTCLAYELIARMIKDNIKVICLDITGEYQSGLSRLLHTKNQESIDRVNASLVTHRNAQNDNEMEGGNHKDFRKTIEKEIEFLLKENNPEMLRIWNPENFDVTKQKWQGGKVIIPLTLVEITRIISEVLLSVIQKNGFSKNAKVCLVFEEAHSLIPEWNSVSEEVDKQASVATAKAIMQGRKYGMGCLVITQRTANVIKSVLNQCNTVFAMRVFDSTGMEFLKNYIGEEYTEVLTCLKDRHVVIFGRASSSNQPVVIRLNENEDFISKFELPDLLNKTVPNFNVG